MIVLLKLLILVQVLEESERSRKALEFQLKMKTLEIEAALDTAEETRKKIMELTSAKQKVPHCQNHTTMNVSHQELDDQIVNRLLHKHNVKPTEEKVGVVVGVVWVEMLVVHLCIFIKFLCG